MSDNVILTRHDRGDQGTFGTILVPGGPHFFTGELPFRDNDPGLSCILPGVYNVLWTFSPAFHRMMYTVTGVAGRDGIRIHPANFMGDKLKGYLVQLRGCIALGEKVGFMGGQKAILVSAPAVRSFETAMGQKSFKLEIIDG